MTEALKDQWLSGNRLIIPEANINVLEKKMLERNQILQLIEMAFVKTDSDYALTYDLADHVTVKDYLVSLDRPYLNEQEYLLIMESFLRRLRSIEMYFLNPEHFLIDVSGLYYHLKTRKWEFIYIPLNRKKSEETVDERVRQLAQKLLTYVNQERQSVEMETLQSLLTVPHFNLNRFYEELYRFEAQIPEVAIDYADGTPVEPVGKISQRFSAGSFFERLKKPREKETPTTETEPGAKGKYQKNLILTILVSLAAVFVISELLTNQLLLVPSIGSVVLACLVACLIQRKRYHGTGAKGDVPPEPWTPESQPAKLPQKKRNMISVVMIGLLSLVAAREIIGMNWILAVVAGLVVLVCAIMCIVIGYQGKTKGTAKQTRAPHEGVGEQSEGYFKAARGSESVGEEPAVAEVAEWPRPVEAQPLEEDVARASYGENELAFDRETEGAHEREVQTTLTLEDEMTKIMKNKMIDASMNPFLILEKKVDKKMAEQIYIYKQHFLVGRSDSQVDYVDVEEGVSRFQFELFYLQDSILLRDLKSRYGTLLNGERLAAYRLYEVKVGDTISLKNSVYEVRNSSQKKAGKARPYG